MLPSLCCHRPLFRPAISNVAIQEWRQRLQTETLAIRSASSSRGSSSSLLFCAGFSTKKSRWINITRRLLPIFPQDGHFASRFTRVAVFHIGQPPVTKGGDRERVWHNSIKSLRPRRVLLWGAKLPRDVATTPSSPERSEGHGKNWLADVCYPLTAYRVFQICVELFARELFDHAEEFFFQYNKFWWLCLSAGKSRFLLVTEFL